MLVSIAGLAKEIFCWHERCHLSEVHGGLIHRDRKKKKPHETREASENNKRLCSASLRINSFRDFCKTLVSFLLTSSVCCSKLANSFSPVNRRSFRHWGFSPKRWKILSSLRICPRVTSRYSCRALFSCWYCALSINLGNASVI